VICLVINESEGTISYNAKNAQVHEYILANFRKLQDISVSFNRTYTDKNSFE